ncbi:hypothetical protein EV702DRAFT_1179093 [Suillus placidus]|uniref:Uncharacterized protein n=1 Tax=Suillus placidus TaxID=48579 RepID=A0A9P6ZWH6_9AGAM|nr:hypothetical protein EV702DRAFT_1179093 [Suillus placidus]
MVGAFHGHLDWHPMYIHRHQVIEEHYTFWDTHKYVALSTFLWNHYREALKSVQMLTAELKAIKCELGLSDGDFPGFFAEDHIYLETLKHLPPRDQLCIHYVEVLNELTGQRADWDVPCKAGNNALTGTNATILKQINQVLKQACVHMDSSYAKLQNAEMLVAHCKTLLSVDERWIIGSKEYSGFKEEATLRKYCAVLDELEHLSHKIV